MYRNRALTPLVFAAVYWRRATKAGCYASTMVTAVGWVWFYSQGSVTVPGTDIMVVAVLLPLSAVAMVVVSLCTQPPVNTSDFFEETA